MNNIKMKLNNKIIGKKAQEEMVGFALIIVLVAVIALVLLGIMIRTPRSQEASQSSELDSFTKSVASYTTECEISGRGFRTVSELTSDCADRGGVCENGIAYCEVLSSTLKDIMNASYNVANTNNVKYYKAQIVKGSGNFSQDIIRPIINGNAETCNNKFFSDYSISTSSGLASFRLEICYK
ncbi:hypothetical protein HYW74_00710 [Candidatus Pacearchaeota archaeon]|nr:hypothetical protein [Candidatus Pacearchaeota archaeon]